MAVEELSAEAGAGLALGAVTFVVLVYAVVVRVRRARASGARIVSDPDLNGEGLKSGKAWEDVDLEKAQVPESVPEPKPVRSPPSPSKLMLSSDAQKQLGALLRQLLEQEVSESLEAGIGERLDSLERRVLESIGRTSPGPAPPEVPPPAMPTAPASMPPPLLQEMCTAGVQTTAADPLLVEKSIAAQEEFREEFKPRNTATKPQPDLSFGPTVRQRGLPDPPEKSLMDVPQVASLKSSLACVREKLAARDSQTTELQRQLKECRQELWSRTEEQKVADLRLREIVSDPQQGPRVQAEEVQRLSNSVQELSSRLAKARDSETYWSSVAKRQRAFFLQSERIAQSGPESANHIKNHPAGDIFIAPAPILGEAGDMGPVWDVGTAVANPYLCDSWPFEPNVLARRGPQEPFMPPCEEEEDEDDERATDEESAEEGEGTSPKRLPQLRLPTLPVAQDDGDDLSDEDDEHHQGSHLDQLPAAPTDTSRSL